MSSKMEEKPKLINFVDLKKELEFLRKSLDYKNVKLCKKLLDEVLKEYFGDI